MTTKYAYEYRNHLTGWLWMRGRFDVPGERPEDWRSGIKLLRQQASKWTEGTELRLVEITTTETFSEAIERSPSVTSAE